jgi:phage gpG-like protein
MAKKTGHGFISYHVKNDEDFQSGIRRAVLAVSDLRPALQEVARDFYESQQVIFRLKGAGQYDPFQGPLVKNTWKNPGFPERRTRDGNKTSYQNTKLRKYGFDYPLLKATGPLQEAASVQGGNGNITEITKTGITMGVDGSQIPYANYHQSDDERKKIPLRKFLFIGPESGFADQRQRGRLERWNNILNTFVLRSLGATLGQATGPSSNRGNS